MTTTGITYNVLILFCTITGVVFTILSFVITRLFDSWRMRGKYAPLLNGNGYQLKSESKKCKDERQEMEKVIVTILRRMEKRMVLGNLVMRRLIEVNPKVPDNEILKLEQDLGIDLQNRDFGIPD